MNRQSQFGLPTENDAFDPILDQSIRLDRGVPQRPVPSRNLSASEVRDMSLHAQGQLSCENAVFGREDIQRWLFDRFPCALRHFLLVFPVHLSCSVPVEWSVHAVPHELLDVEVQLLFDRQS